MLRFDITYSDLRNFIQTLRVRVGLDLSGYSESFLKRRIGGFLDEHKLQSTDDLIYYLLKGQSNIDAFLFKFFPNKTELFRDPDLWNYLFDIILGQKLNGQKVSVFELGTANGEEAFSFEYLKKLKGLSNVSLTASFMCKLKMELFQELEFSEKNLETSTINFKTLFEQDINNIIVNKTFKSFKVQPDYVAETKTMYFDLIKSKVEEKYDIVLCRNILCYLSDKKEKTVHRSLTDMVKPNGYLILGVGEDLVNSIFKRNFKLIEPDLKVYQKVG